MNRGWMCPNCGGCYSPATPQCFNCTGRTSVSCGTQMDVYHMMTVPPSPEQATIMIGGKVYYLEVDGQIKPVTGN